MAKEQKHIKSMEYLNELEDLFDNASVTPVIGGLRVNLAEVKDLIQSIRLEMPEDLKTAVWVSQQKDEILDQANESAARIAAESLAKSRNLIAEAEDNSLQIRSEAQEKAAQLVADDVITAQAKIEAADIIAAAKEEAQQIKIGAYRYAEDMMQRLEVDIAKTMENLAENRQILNTYRDKVEND